MNIKTAQERLGHANPRTTLAVYAQATKKLTGRPDAGLCFQANLGGETGTTTDNAGFGRVWSYSSRPAAARASSGSS